ncbi:ABC transporter substrate-binding protein [Actinoplanes sp. RD1]|uniref:ABC transporter substrate-binding protein n=1 Tax=Actinoplanes sp. RD1 TaxID=3064538 RepID=UPI002740EF5D|nr:ABC transporter substrate-binding protein [Actinoplanes sp. RD1]
MSRRLPAVLAALTLVISAAACGSGGTETTASGNVKVKIGVIPIVDVAPIYLGVQKGFFTEQKLEVSLETAQGGAAIVPGVVAGQYQFGFSNTVSLLLAGAQGLPLKVVANGVASTGEEGKDFGAVIVKKGSPITSAKDLAGKRVAVNTLRNINTTTVSNVVRKAGGDPTTITYVELPFPDIVSAVAKGDVDAGQVVEPFLTIATGQGDTQVVSNYAGTAPGLTVGMYFTSKQFAQQNADAVKGFTAAMTKSLEYASAHPDEARAVLTSYTKIDPAVQQKMVLPKWPATVDKASVQVLADLATQDGVLTKQPDLNALLP